MLAHLRGYPDELRRFTNSMKQAHSEGRGATAFFLSRPAAQDSFLATVCRLVEAGEDIVTVVEAAEILGCSPSALLDSAQAGRLPRPLSGEGRHRLWRRADIVARRGSGCVPAEGA